jgi:hypothetical protein
VRISDANDIEILDEENNELLKIGRLEGQNSVGMRTSVGKSNEIVIGDTGFKDEKTIENGGHGKIVFKAGPPPYLDTEDNIWKDASSLRIYEDGFLYAANSQIGGTLAPT